MLLQLQRGAVYGPVQSRRLGRSLGVNVLPPSVKVCTFNCLYCQYGWTKVCPLRVHERYRWPAVAEILGELERTLWELVEQPAYITFSGNGEPTLHPRFGELVDGVIHLRNRLAPHARTAILSNSATIAARDERHMAVCSGGVLMPCGAGVDSFSVRSSLERLDVRIMKLDCGTDGVLRRYNRPCGKTGIDDIVAGLMKLDDISIQALITGGEMGNSGSGEITAWIERVAALRPLHVQIYTLDRGYASPRIAPLSPECLREIGTTLKTAGIATGVY